MAWYSRFLNVFRSDDLSRDVDRELQFHVAELADRLEESGMSRGAALHEARKRFGNRTAQQERTHDADVFVWLESILADLRYAARTLVGSPGFALVAILSLALGIGANTAIFSLTDALLLKPLPVAHPEQLRKITMGTPDNDEFTNPLWERIRDVKGAFTGAVAYGTDRFDLAKGGVQRMTSAAWVSGDFFRVLGVRSIAGRVLDPSDDMRGCAGAAAVGAGFAQREFGSPDAAVGKTISLEGHPVPVVGVIDPDFSGLYVGRTADVYVPECMQAIIYGPDVLDNRSRWYLNIVVRIDSTTNDAQLDARLAAAAQGIYAATLPTTGGVADKAEYLKNKLASARALTGLSELRDRYGPALFILSIVVGVVLIIACANIANLLLARAAARQREIAIRLAVGASRWRVVRQLLTESLLLAFAGAALGALFASWASRLIVGFIRAGRTTAWLDLSPDLRVFAFTAAVAAGTAVLFGLLPAWRATRLDPQTSLKAGGRGTVGDGRHRLGKALVVAQVALSLALVAASGLLLGSFRKLVTMDAGFRRDGVLLVTMGLASSSSKRAELDATKLDLVRRARAIPGVTVASGSLLTPLAGFSWNELVRAPGFSPTDRKDSLVFFNEVTDDFFATLGTPLLEGRDIREADLESSHKVAVINALMAKKFFAGGSAIGRTFNVMNGDSIGPPVEVIGVVADAKYQRLDEETKYTAYVPVGGAEFGEKSMTVSMRTRGDPLALLPGIRAAAAAVNPAISLGVTTFDAQVNNSLARPRLLATLSVFFGALALLLAVIGLYGTMSYSVERRRNEIGVRMALGAAKDQVLGLVVREAGRLIALGIVAGALLALASTRLVAGMLYGITPTDPATLVMSAVALATVALAAALLPAWRAARLDPMEALRDS